MVRDYQRKRVYDAEKTLMTGRPLADIDAVVSFVDTVVQMPEFRGKYGNWTIRVGDGRGRRRAGGWMLRPGLGEIFMPRWSRNKLIVLHELAHCLTHSHELAWHGPEFTAVYCDLVGMVLGKTVESRLRGRFQKLKVDVAENYRSPYRMGLMFSKGPSAHKKYKVLAKEQYESLG